MGRGIGREKAFRSVFSFSFVFFFFTKNVLKMINEKKKTKNPKKKQKLFFSGAPGPHRVRPDEQGRGLGLVHDHGGQGRDQGKKKRKREEVKKKVSFAAAVVASPPPFLNSPTLSLPFLPPPPLEPKKKTKKSIVVGNLLVRPRPPPLRVRLRVRDPGNLPGHSPRNPHPGARRQNRKDVPRGRHLPDAALQAPVGEERAALWRGARAVPGAGAVAGSGGMRFWSFFFVFWKGWGRGREEEERENSFAHSLSLQPLFPLLFKKTGSAPRRRGSRAAQGVVEE